MLPTKKKGTIHPIVFHSDRRRLVIDHDHSMVKRVIRMIHTHASKKNDSKSNGYIQAATNYVGKQLPSEHRQRDNSNPFPLNKAFYGKNKTAKLSQVAGKSFTTTPVFSPLEKSVLLAQALAQEGHDVRVVSMVKKHLGEAIFVELPDGRLADVTLGVIHRKSLKLFGSSLTLRYKPVVNVHEQTRTVTKGEHKLTLIVNKPGGRRKNRPK